MASVVSKIFEKLNTTRITPHIQKYYSKFQAGGTQSRSIGVL